MLIYVYIHRRSPRAPHKVYQTRDNCCFFVFISMFMCQSFFML